MQFGTLWGVFAVRRGSILVHRGDQEFRFFDLQEPDFDPPEDPPADANPARGAF